MPLTHGEEERHVDCRGAGFWENISVRQEEKPVIVRLETTPRRSRLWVVHSLSGHLGLQAVCSCSGVAARYIPHQLRARSGREGLRRVWEGPAGSRVVPVSHQRGILVLGGSFCALSDKTFPFEVFCSN